MPRNRDRRYVTDYECAVWLTMPKAKWVFNRQSSSYDRPLYNNALTPSSEKVGHTTQKPIKLMEDILRTHSNEGDTVLDMFMGSGAAIKAAHNLNRKAIGIEMGHCEKKGHKYEGVHWVDVLVEEMELIC